MSTQGFMPITASTTATVTAISAGIMKFLRRLSVEVLRQASSGPTAVSSNRKSAIGMLTLLKNGGPTVTLCPVTHSLSTGNNVPQSTANAATSSSTLLNRKLDSRETSDSSLCSLSRCARLRTKKNRHTAKVSARKTTKYGPISDSAKAWTELTTPERVRNVPKMASRNVEKISHMFHTFIIPRFSCIITECRNAVPVNHGNREAFSTGSHPHQ